MPTIIEFKAKTNDLAKAEQKLLTLNPTFIGIDNQKDTYYSITNGRLKLREGNIENALIHYTRANTPDTKQSNVLLYKHKPSEDLKRILETVHGIKVVVQKQRKIYFVNNVKIHFDEVSPLGSFIEVEAIDNDNEFTVEELQVQCNFYVNFFEVNIEDFQANSYSDLLLAAKV